MDINKNLKLFYYFKGKDKKVTLVFAKRYAEETFMDKEYQERWLKSLYRMI